MNPLLRRQLRTLGLDPDVPPGTEGWSALLETIERSYESSDQGRYLLERSLQLSSTEMHLNNRRQQTIAACSRALLTSGTDDAIDAALTQLIDMTNGTCAAIDVNVTRAGIDHRERRWAVCSGRGNHDDVEVTEWSTAPDMRAELESGGMMTIAMTDCTGSTTSNIAAVPIHSVAGWVATLFVSSPEDQPWDRADRQMLQVVAEMLGASFDQQQARRELEALNAAKDELISSVSHELRTPLSVVLGMANELGEHFEAFTADEVSELATMIRDESTHIANLIDDLLVASRASSGLLTVLPQPLDAGHELLMFVAEHHRYDGVVVDAASVPLQADRSRLRQILRNLLSNAVVHGGAKITVSSESVDGRCVITVSDNGPGVPEALAAEIFEPFHRIYQDRHRPGPLGIGLTVCKQLAELMGGRLRYRRDDDLTVFELELPQHSPVEDAIGPTSLRSEPQLTE